jgi:hypothetical protein
LWFAHRSLAVIPVLLIVIMLASGATRTVHAPQGLPGTPIGGGPAPASVGLVVNEDGKLITLPGSVTAGDIVLCETFVGDTGAGCEANTPWSWSDVLRFCDTPLDDASCKSATTATHAQLFTDGEGAIAGFTDEFTGHSLDASKLTANAVFIEESTTGPTHIDTDYTVNSDPTGPGEVVEHPVGGYLQPINTTQVLSAMLVQGAAGYWWLLAIAAAIVLAIVALKRRRAQLGKT